MLNRLVAVATTLLILGTPLVTAAQAPQERAPAAPQTSPPTSRQPQQFVNIRLDLTITILDPRGTSVAPGRTVSMFLVDRDPGRLRIGAAANSSARSAEGTPTSAGTGPMLNVDVTPETLTNGRIRVHLGLEYRPASIESEKGNPLHINERVSAVLEDGKPLVVSQTPDPASDRTVKVELKATIVK